MGFVEWVLDHCSSGTPIGDFARDLRHDEGFPLNGTFEDMYAYLRREGACYGALEGFENAVSLFGGHIGDVDVAEPVAGAGLELPGYMANSSILEKIMFIERSTNEVLHTTISNVGVKLTITMSMKHGSDHILQTDSPPCNLVVSGSSPEICAKTLDAKVSISQYQFLRAVQYKPLSASAGAKKMFDHLQNQLFGCERHFYMDSCNRACLVMNKYGGSEKYILLFLSLCIGRHAASRWESASPPLLVETYRGKGPWKSTCDPCGDLDVDLYDGTRIHMHRPCVYVIRGSPSRWKEVQLSHGNELICIEVSASVMSAEGPKCFPAGTLFKTPSDMFVPVEQTTFGTRVVASNGTVLSVTIIRKHEGSTHGPFRFVRLLTESAEIVVTDDHRMLAGDGQIVCASALSQGNRVLVSGNVPEALVAVEPFSATMDVYEVAFMPDEPVEAFQQPAAQILSLGTTSHQGGRRLTRRPGMNRRLQRQQVAAADGISMPATYDEYA
jgi:hypothetical protein